MKAGKEIVGIDIRTTKISRFAFLDLAAWGIEGLGLASINNSMAKDYLLRKKAANELDKGLIDGLTPREYNEVSEDIGKLSKLPVSNLNTDQRLDVFGKQLDTIPDPSRRSLLAVVIAHWYFDRKEYELASKRLFTGAVLAGLAGAYLAVRDWWKNTRTATSG